MLCVRLITTLLIILTAGCNLHPVYAEKDPYYLGALLPVIEVEKISGQDGYFLEDKLKKLLEPHNLPNSFPGPYRLKINYSSSIEGVAFQSSGVITRYNIIGNAPYELYNTNNQTVCSGNIKLINSYDAMNAVYAESVAQQRTMANNISAIAEEIKVRLLTCLAQKQP